MKKDRWLKSGYTYNRKQKNSNASGYILHNY